MNTQVEESVQASQTGMMDGASTSSWMVSVNSSPSIIALISKV